MTPVEEYLCVDVQGYTASEFIPKELTLITQDNVVHHFLFDTPKGGFPYEHRRSVEWLEDHHHGIYYGTMGIAFNGDIFLHFPARVVYVKGQLKEKFMEKIYDRVINLEYLSDSPKIAKTVDYCTYHNKMGYSWVCSNNNARMLKSYVDENIVY